MWENQPLDLSQTYDLTQPKNAHILGYATPTASCFYPQHLFESPSETKKVEY